MTDLGEISYILSIHVTRDHKAGCISLSQQKYIEEILERFGKTDVCPISTPALTNKHLTKLTSPEVNIKSYQSALSALMYPMLRTHPNLTYAIGALSRHTANPGEEHKCAMDRVFWYLQATKDWCLTFQHGAMGGLTLTGFIDADWANKLSDCSLTSGYVYRLVGGAISWSSKKQSSVALSSTKAKYIARAHTAKEVIWPRHLLAEIGLHDDNPTTLLMDNQSAIAIAKNPQFHNRTKHIEVHHHFLHHKVKKEEMELEYIPMNEQVADALTKGLN